MTCYDLEEVSLPWLTWLSAGSVQWLFCMWRGHPPLNWETGSTSGHCGQRNKIQIREVEEQVSDFTVYRHF